MLCIAQNTVAQCASPIATFPYNEDFEITNGAWTPGGTGSDWAWGTPTKPVITGAGSGTKCWVIGGLTGDQRFFLGFAQVWRQNIRPEALKLRINTDPHAPGSFRCNGPLSNMTEFARAFGLEEGVPMVRPAGARAKIW